MATVVGNELKHIKTLLTKKGRKAHRQFVAEGVRVLEEAIRHGARPEVVYCADSMLSERGGEVAKSFALAGVPVKHLSARQEKGIADAATSQGILAVFASPDGALAELCRPSIRKILLCENIADPGNLGTLIRSAAAFDFQLVCLSGACAEPYSPKVVRSTAGAIFAVKVAEADTDEIHALIRGRSMTLIAADGTGESDPPELADMVSTGTSVLAIGSEAEGLSGDWLHAADLVVRLEHEPAVESLNAAIAGSILMKRIYDLTHEGTS